MAKLTASQLVRIIMVWFLRVHISGVAKGGGGVKVPP